MAEGGAACAVGVAYALPPLSLAVLTLALVWRMVLVMVLLL
jgi:hypothetical protein